MPNQSLEPTAGRSGAQTLRRGRQGFVRRLSRAKLGLLTGGGVSDMLVGVFGNFSRSFPQPGNRDIHTNKFPLALYAEFNFRPYFSLGRLGAC